MSNAIDISHVSRTFAVAGREVHALNNISISIPTGAFVVMMGPSGSGKTTLLNLVGGLDEPSNGSIMVEGQALERKSGADLAAMRRKIGFIFQSFALLPTSSAYENVEVGLRLSGNVPRREWDTRIRACLRDVGLSKYIDHRPYEMSGGQQQRVAIARALAIRPRLILADEPTGDLDTVTGERILTMLRGLVDRERITILMATHDQQATEFATDVYRLHDGTVASHERNGQPIPLE